MQVITSKENEKVKHIKKLKDKKYRDEKSQYIIEGVKMIEEAIAENQVVDTVVICEEYINNDTLSSKFLYEIAENECIYVNEKIFSSLTDVVNPQGILAIMDKNNSNKKIDYTDKFILILDDVQDPGNLGTILRTADSVGLKQIVVSKGSVDIYNSKVVRSTMGAIFRTRVIEVEDMEETILQIKKEKFKVLVTSLNTDKSIYDKKLDKVAVVIGNEARGVSEKVIKKADELVKIPMLGRAESLNASVAASVIMYEYVRQQLL